MTSYRVRKVDGGLVIIEAVPARGFRVGVVSALEVPAEDYRLDAEHYFSRGLVREVEPDEDWEHPRSSTIDAEPSKDCLSCGAGPGYWMNGLCDRQGCPTHALVDAEIAKARQ